MVNSRTKGHNYERQIAKELRELGYKDCKTSRYANREQDDLGVDLVNTGKFAIQCKNYKNYSPKQIIEDLKRIQENIDGIPVEFLKITGKGEIVCMDKETFYKLIKNS